MTMDDKSTEQVLTAVNSLQKDNQAVKIKDWSAMTKREQNNREYLIAQKEAYERTYDDPNSNKTYIKIDNALFDIEQKEKKQFDKTGGREDYSSLSDSEKRELVCSLLDPHYRKGFGQDGTKRMLRVIDKDNKIVAIVDNKQAMQEQIEQTIADLVVAQGETLSPYLINELARYWNLYGQTIPDGVKTYGGLSDDGWVLGRSKHKPKSGPMPTWDNFLDRMNDPKAFAAWIYGVASKQYRGRQVLWFHGASGEDGKTYVQKLIARELFPNVTAAMSNQSLNEGAARFMQAEFENKALATWGDCNNASALLREDIKQLSAGAEGDVARVEKKNKQAYSAQMEAVMWINSNFRPVVTGDNYVRSRLLYINIGKMEEQADVNIGVKFVAELPAFLAYGQRCYEELCRDNRKIAQNEIANEEIEEMVLDAEGEYQSIFARHFIEVKTSEKLSVVTYTLVSDIPPILKKEGLKSNNSQGWWYDWLKQRHGYFKTFKMINGKKTSIIVGLKIKKEIWQQ